MPGEEPQKSVFKKEIDAAADLLMKLEHENEFVWCDKIASGDELPSLQAKVIVQKSDIKDKTQNSSVNKVIPCSWLFTATHFPFPSNHAGTRTTLSSPLSTTRLTSVSHNPNRINNVALKLSTPSPRLSKVVSAVTSEESAVGSINSGTDVFKLTYLEGNSWLWDVGGLKILVDPILVGNLDFGIPWLYDAAKKFLKNFQLSDLPEVDCLLITQSLDDHCHLKTLEPLSKMYPNLKVIATPNAKPLLDPLFNNVSDTIQISYLEKTIDKCYTKLVFPINHSPRQPCLGNFLQTHWHQNLSAIIPDINLVRSAEVEAKNGSKVKLKATAGPVLGPPWQRPENGYLVNSPQGQLTLYYEPHCIYNKNFLEKEHADIVISPVIKQQLPKFTLVSGQEDAVLLAKLLNAKFVVPMKNGDLDSKGFLASIVQAEGTVESFKELLSKELPDAQVLEPTPGVPLEISAPSNVL
ncbi:hypothetical protein Pint_23315 [Pistacia integerrima]|uniref:Uncharacterized protein n=1 Tax=Pistacia integerrima TaxID=434235 RepID=A0ACC0YNH7_9ROSI|nr:hypothetical protein Pint_23315 [Pistacia integerrima]